MQRPGLWKRVPRTAGMRIALAGGAMRKSHKEFIVALRLQQPTSQVKGGGSREAGSLVSHHTCRCHMAHPVSH